MHSAPARHWAIPVALLLVCLGGASSVEAQEGAKLPAPPRTAADAPATDAADAAPAGPLPGPDGPSIAQPAAEAAPAEVEAAEETAQAAELHPIIPSPQNPLRPAFQLYAEFDIPIMGIGLVFAASRLARSQPAYCSPRCSRADLNSLDRLTAGTWSPRWQLASDVGLYTLMAGAATLLLIDDRGLAALNDMVVIAESALAATAVASILTLATSRPRPFVYGEKAPLSERNGSNASLSFLSSHAAIAFAIATSSYMASRRLHPNSRMPLRVLGVGTAIAAFVGTARVLGGMHFITDAFGGAIVGASMGVLVPALHGSPVTVVPVGGTAHKGLALMGRF